MIIFGNRILTAVASLVFIATAFFAAYFTQPVLLLAPLVLIVVLFFVQYPQLLFYTLLFFIPWSFEYNINAGLGTDLPDEPLMLLMAFTALVLFIVKRRSIAWQQHVHPLLFILFVSIAWTAVTVATSTNFVFSAKYFLAKCWYLPAFVAAPLLLPHHKKTIKRSALVLFLSMFTLTCVALYRHAQFDFRFIKINDAVAPFFRNHVNYSALLVFMVPLQIAFYRLAKNNVLRFFVLFSIVIVLAALYLSYARGAWLALLVGVIAYWLIKKGWLLRSFLVTVFFVTGIVVWLQKDDRYLHYAPHHDVTIFHQNFSEHLAATYQGKDVSTAERFYRWVAGVRMSKDKWITGFGPTTFYQNYKSYTLPVFRTWVSSNKEQSTVHNYFLLLLIEQGVMGLLLFLILLAAMFWYAQRIHQRTTNPFWKITVAAVAAILAMQCTVNFLSDLIETDKVGSVFYLCLAFLIIADRITRIKTNYTN